MNRAAGIKALRATTQDDRITGFKAERSSIRRHGWPAFIDDTDDAERSCDALNEEPVWTLEVREDAPHGIGKCGNRLKTTGHGFDPGSLEGKALKKSPRGATRLCGNHVARVGREDF